MAVRFRSDFTSLDGYEYRIDIIDKEFSGTLSEFTCGLDSMDGFTLNYEGQNQERWNPILSSNVTINMAIESAFQEAFITDLATQINDRFFVDIYRKTGGYVRMWIGEIATDIITYEDADYPYLFQITAYDGFSRLQNVKHTLTKGVDYTFIQLLDHVISKLTVKQFISGYYLRTAINWWEDKMFTTSPSAADDPLLLTKVNSDAFVSTNNLGEIVNISCWDLLLQIAQRWNACFSFGDGMFHFMPINIETINSVDTRKYSSTTTKILENKNYLITAAQYHLNNASYTFMPILGSVAVNYNYKQGSNASNLLVLQNTYPTAVSFGSVQGGGGEKLIFSGNVRIVFNTSVPLSPGFHKWKWNMRLSVGSYYLTNKNGYAQWSLNSADRYTVISQLYEDMNYVEYVPISFTTPDLPTSGSGLFSFNFANFLDNVGDVKTMPSGVSTSFSCIAFSIKQNINNELDDGTITYRANNNINISKVNNQLVQLIDVVTGDGPFVYSSGRLLVKNFNAGVFENSEEDWSVGGSGTRLNINNLLVREILGGQNEPYRKLTGDVYEPILTPYQVLSKNSRYYKFLGGSFNANEGVWSGQWCQIISDVSGIVIEDPGSGGAITDGANEIGIIIAQINYRSALAAQTAQASAEAARDSTLLYEGEAGNNAALALTYKNQAETAKTAAQDAQAAAEDAQTECENIRDSL